MESIHDRYDENFVTTTTKLSNSERNQLQNTLGESRVASPGSLGHIEKVTKHRVTAETFKMSSFDGASCDLKSLFYEAAINDEDSSGVQRSIFLCIAVSLLTFCVSSVTGNYSQVDKIWSITPFVYACLMVSDARTFLMAVLATVWGIRLTWNFNRRGGYAWPPWQGDEDYRWKIVQDGFLICLLYTSPSPRDRG